MVVRYIGIDAHTESCTIAVVGASGRRLRSEVVETRATELIELVRSISGRRLACMEEGGQSEWLYELLRPHVEELVVTVPAKRSGSKSDARDAWALAEQLRRGAIDVQVYKSPGSPLRGLREAVRLHTMIVRDVVRVKNRLKAVLRGRGIAATDDLYSPKKRAEALQELAPGLRRLAEVLGQELDGLTEQLKKAQAWLEEESARHPIVKRIATAPGIGPIRAAQIVAVTITADRFRTRQQYWSYCGLGIVTHSSADWQRRDGRWQRAEVLKTRGLNRNRHALLKAAFKGAALAVTAMEGHPLNAHYQRLLEAGTRPPLARLTIARKLAAAVLAMWKHQEDYKLNRAPLTKTA